VGNLTGITKNSLDVTRLSLIASFGAMAICLTMLACGTLLPARPGQLLGQPQTCQTTVLKETRQTETLLHMPAANSPNALGLVPAPAFAMEAPATAPGIQLSKIERIALTREMFVNCLPLVEVKRE
jgi:hypothetical protein